MKRFSLSFKDINKIVLLVAIVSLAYKRGHFSGTFFPSPFQLLFSIALVLTIIYVLKEHMIKDFFLALPKKIVVAGGVLFFSVVLGWIIGNFFIGIPTTHATIQDFGTFTISIITFFLVLFYAKDDKKYATWCLYGLLIPNIFPFLYFLSHGFVGYWGVLNDGSLSGVIDPNLLSKTLLIPALFFISTVLFASRNKKWWLTLIYTVIASLFVMLIFWTASRGSALSLIIGTLLLWILFSIREFSWKKLFEGAAVVFIIITFGFVMVPQGVKQELYTKIVNTGSLPHSADGQLVNIVNDPTVTLNELGQTPRTDVRIYEWSFFLKYALHHPLGVGPSSSSVNYQKGDELQLRPGNTYIQLWLWGGVLALISFLYILQKAFRTLWIQWKKTYNEKTLALISILFALSIAIIFDASLYFYWYFIILALAFSHEQ